MGALIAYFSRRGENYVSGKLKELSVGNTEVAAGMLQQLTGADLFQLEPVHEYPKSYNACIDEAQADQRRDARPELSDTRRAWTDMTPSILDIPTIGGRCPCRYSPFWSISTFPEKPFSPSAPTKAAAWGAANAISNGCVRERPSNQGLPSMGEA